MNRPLPGILADIEAAAGRAAALEFAHVRGGARLYVAKKKPSDWMADLPPSAADALRVAFQGEYIRVPLLTSQHVPNTINAALRAEILVTENAHEIARKLRTTIRHVRRVKAAMKQKESL